MAEIKMRMSTHARLLKDVLTHYKSTFHALKELINNSIQANAKCININLIPSSFLSIVSLHSSRYSSRSFIRASTSFLGLFQFSVEKT